MRGYKCIALLWLALASVAQAHHAFEVYYDTREEAVTSLQGVVKKLSLRSPHSYLVVTVETAEGPKDWILEAPSGMLLSRWGWPLDDFKLGVPIEFTGFPARNGEESMRIQHVNFQGRQFCAFACMPGNLM